MLIEDKETVTFGRSNNPPSFGRDGRTVLASTWNCELASSASLFMGFFFLYYILAMVLLAAFPRFDYFGMDYWYGSKPEPDFRHPLVPLFLEPLSYVMRHLVADRVQQSVLLNAGFGAVAVVLAYQIFRRLLPGSFAPCLLAMLYGLSMNQLVAGSVPETYAISACTLTTTYLLFVVCLQSGRLNLSAWIAAALLSLGITTATVPQTAVAFVLAMRSTGVTNKIWRACAAAGLTLAMAALLLQAQTVWLGRQDLFSPTVWNDELKDINKALAASARLSEAGAGISTQALRNGQELARNLYLLDFVGAHPGRTPEAGSRNRTKIEYFGYPMRFGIMGLAAAALWFVIWGTGLLANLRGLRGHSSPLQRTLFIALAIIISGNMVLLAFYNSVEMFMYTPLTAFAILLLGVNPELFAHSRWQAALAVLVALLGINNMVVILEMVR